MSRCCIDRRRKSGGSCCRGPDPAVIPSAMELVQERPDFDYVLRGADGQRVLVNDLTLTASCIVSPQRLVGDWPVTSLAMLNDDTLAPLFDLNPDVILLGTGERQSFPPASVMAAVL